VMPISAKLHANCCWLDCLGGGKMRTLSARNSALSHCFKAVKVSLLANPRHRAVLEDGCRIGSERPHHPRQ
jgi:hypothetical protein